MTPTELRERAYTKIDALPEDALRIVVDILENMSSEMGESRIDSHGPISRDSFGILKGKVVLSDDFFETPECFKEYV